MPALQDVSLEKLSKLPFFEHYDSDSEPDMSSVSYYAHDGWCEQDANNIMSYQTLANFLEKAPKNVAAKYLYCYAAWSLRQRWLPAEPYLKGTKYAQAYANNVLKMPWPAAGIDTAQIDAADYASQSVDQAEVTPEIKTCLLRESLYRRPLWPYYMAVRHSQPECLTPDLQALISSSNSMADFIRQANDKQQLAFANCLTVNTPVAKAVTCDRQQWLAYDGRHEPIDAVDMSYVEKLKAQPISSLYGTRWLSREFARYLRRGRWHKGVPALEPWLEKYGSRRDIEWYQSATDRPWPYPRPKLNYYANSSYYDQDTGDFFECHFHVEVQPDAGASFATYRHQCFAPEAFRNTLWRDLNKDVLEDWPNIAVIRILRLHYDEPQTYAGFDLGNMTTGRSGFGAFASTFAAHGFRLQQTDRRQYYHVEAITTSSTTSPAASPATLP